MKKVVPILLAILLVISAFAIPALAKGGSAKGTDVWWENGGVTKAIFSTTGSGIVQQHRYDPDDKHLIFKPQSKFPTMPEGEGWFAWTFTDQYTELSGDEGDLSDFFNFGETYWVKINTQG